MQRGNLGKKKRIVILLVNPAKSYRHKALGWRTCPGLEKVMDQWANQTWDRHLSQQSPTEQVLRKHQEESRTFPKEF